MSIGRNTRITLLASALCCAILSPAEAQLTQQGQKLVGAGAADPAHQGYSVALSADGNTALIGGSGNNLNGVGASWVFTRSGGVWSEQAKLVGTGAVGAAYQGQSVALSADGNTAVVGGYRDDDFAGAAWVFTRSGGVWSQQGNKLVGTGTVGVAEQGYSVALSGDGNSAIVGGVFDNGGVGAAWVFTRSGGVWSQQGAKLVGTGAVGVAEQGWSVSVSADGNTAVVGGVGDNAYAGATWVFTRSGGAWSQQGARLVGTGAVDPANQGYSVALSADGNTVFVGGLGDNAFAGATWVFTRSGGVWSQQGAKLVGTGAVGAAYQGQSVALSSDGNTAAVGGWTDNSVTGATWVFTRGGGVWSQQGAKLVGTGAAGAAAQGFSVALSADGNTALEGGFVDNGGVGAAWVFAASNRPPDCSHAVASEPVLWPPNHQYHAISINRVTDPDGDPVAITVTGITQDEPVNGREDGNTCPDAQIIGGQATVRAERAGTRGNTGNGRVYVISFTASDGKGGQCTGTVSVCVPLDQDDPTCVDDGQNFNSVLADCRSSNNLSPEALSLNVGQVTESQADFTFALPKDLHVDVSVFDVTGRRMATIEDAQLTSGVYQRAWNMDGVARGLYFIRMHVGEVTLTKTVVKVR